MLDVRAACCCWAMIGIAIFSLPVAGAQTTADTPADADDRHLIAFEPNRGQADAGVRFLSRGAGYSLHLTSGGAILHLSQIGKTPYSVVRLKLVGANPSAQTEGRHLLPRTTNYFVGRDPALWRTNIPSYSEVYYHDVYPGIDLVYHGRLRRIEYDFLVAPSINPSTITLQFEGTGPIELDASGDLVLRTPSGELRHHKPTVYQPIGGVKRLVEARYVLRSGRRVGFQVAKYDLSQPLVIDPALGYSTYLGGGGRPGDSASAVAVDTAGNVYVAGSACSPDFPVTPNAYQPRSGGTPRLSLCGDAFVAKFSRTGTLLYSTYLGGGEGDAATAIAVDRAGAAYVSGVTLSADFPTTSGAFQRTYGGNGVFQFLGFGGDAFVTKLSPNGNALTYSTYLGGNDIDWARGMSVDATGNVYVCGQTSSRNFPTTAAAVQPTNSKILDSLGFVTKLNPTGSALVYSTFLGGSKVDVATGVAQDSLGNAWVTGTTSSTDFPTTAGGFQRSYGGGTDDSFVLKLDAGAGSILYSSFLGGSGGESNSLYGPAIAIDNNTGNVYVTGKTTSSELPTTSGAFQAQPGGSLLLKLNPGGTISYLTYLPVESRAIAVDSVGSALLTGTTTELQTTEDAVQVVPGGGGDSFLLKINAGGTGRVFSTLLGGARADVGNGIALDGDSVVYIAGESRSSDFPTTSDAFQSAFRGTDTTGNAFVSRIDLDAPSSPGPRVDSISPSSVVAGQIATLTVSGSNFQNGLRATLTTGSGTSTVPPTDLSFINSTQVRVQVTMGATPSAPYTATLRITNPDGKSAKGTFQVVEATPPVVSAISPNSVEVGVSTTLIVTGRNFQTGFTATVSTAGGTSTIPPAGLSFVDSTQLRVQVTMGATPSPPYTVTLRIMNPDGRSATGTFQVVESTQPRVSAVSNGASFLAPPVAPGSIISIFGSNLATSTVQASRVPLDTTLGATSVNVGGRNIPLFYVSPGQINGQLPYEAQPGSTTITVTSTGRTSAASTFLVGPTAPGIFQFSGDVSNRCVAQNQDYSLNQPGREARSGTVVLAYLTGQGAVDNRVATGEPAPSAPLSRPIASASATIGGRTANLEFIGLAPGFVAVSQANIRVPDLPTGNQQVEITIGDTKSNRCVISVIGN